jgi:hypothetical protein
VADEKAKAPVVAEKKAEAPNKAPTHVRFVGHPDHREDPATVVFGKRFHRWKWVPLANLDGTAPDKVPLTEQQLNKLRGNPAFELGDGTDTSRPGSGLLNDQEEEAEEA